MTTRRAQVFLYTDAAQIDARTRKAMVAAGFLPVKVASLDAVKLIDAPINAPEMAPLDEITWAALAQILNDGFSTQSGFAARLCKRLIEDSDRKRAAIEAAREELGDG